MRIKYQKLIEKIENTYCSSKKISEHDSNQKKYKKTIFIL